MRRITRLKYPFLAGLLASSLAACGSGGASGSDGASDAGDDSTGGEAAAAADAIADSGIAGMTSETVEAEFQTVEDPDSFLLAPGVDLHITDVATADVITPNVYEEITGDAPTAEEGVEEIETVAAAEGETFFLAKFTSSDPQWEPRGEIPQTEGHLVVEASEEGRVLNTDDGTRHQGTLLVSLPETAEPGDALLEIETQEKFQSLSLIDGSRVSSDVPSVYESAGITAEVTDADHIDESFPGWASGDDRVMGEVTSAFTAPWLDRSDDGDGWAPEGKMYLSVEVDWRKVSATTFDESTMYVELPDGDVVHPQSNISVGTKFSDNVVFHIPVDVDTLTVVIEPKVVVGAGNSAPEHEWDDLEATVEFSGADEGTPEGSNA
ncbi:MAG TPA: hypothetical protein VK098_04605 [Beutenbergiaceae bacterium]|nr:hypothetical protein [Beutenbergiaceae bacterium]